MTELITEITSLREILKEYKNNGQTVGFVPTMGALHRGHESLITKARSECDKVIVSIFVNPIQFGPNEDFDRYPRQIEADRQVCEKIGADFIFVPSVQEMYPEGKESLTTVIPPNNFQNKLCGKSRMGHFNGVATVVLKLFNIVQPNIAYFGQKDAQQFIIIKKMVRDLNIPIEITGCPIVRDDDGLALSSRNAYLSADERQKALSLSKVLKNIQSDYKSGISSFKELINNAMPLLFYPDVELEYLEAFDTVTMEQVDILKENTLVAIAAKVGNVRLIDNFII